MTVPIYPEFISFRDFADRFHEDYLEAFLPINIDESEWHKWATAVASNEYFLKYSIPQPAQINEGKITPSYKTWQEWAKRLYICINNNINEEVNA